jgi:hypothetical protein
MSLRPEAALPNCFVEAHMSNKDAKAKDDGKHQSTGTTTPDPFVLEKVYPDASSLFARYPEPVTTDKAVMVVLDANSLLLPHSMKPVNLQALKKAFENLANEKGLFIAGRTARKFAKMRDKKFRRISGNAQQT